MDSDKRRKRQESNRRAAKESRLRRKARTEELQRAIVFVSRENEELQEENMILVETLKQASPDTGRIIAHMKHENTALKVALFECVQTLARISAVAPDLVASIPGVMPSGSSVQSLHASSRVAGAAAAGAAQGEASRATSVPPAASSDPAVRSRAMNAGAAGPQQDATAAAAAAAAASASAISVDRSTAHLGSASMDGSGAGYGGSHNHASAAVVRAEGGKGGGAVGNTSPEMDGAID